MSFCGVTGVTPTYGRVSRYGLTAFASSLDHIGPVCGHGSGCRPAAPQIIAGRDEMDSTSAFAPVPDYAAALDGNVRGKKIGLLKEFFDGLASETAGYLILQGRGRVEEARLRGARDSVAAHLLYAVACCYVIAYGRGEFEPGTLRWCALYRASLFRRAPWPVDMYRVTRNEGFGDECKRRIMLGTYVLSASYYDAYYLKQKVRALVARDYQQAFEQVDAIVGPVSALPGFQVRRDGGRPSRHVPGRHLHHHRGDLAGVPCT